MKLYEKVLSHIIKRSNDNDSNINESSIIRDLKLKPKHLDKIKESIAYLESNGLIEVHETLDANSSWNYSPTDKGISYNTNKIPWYKEAYVIAWVAILNTIILAILVHYKIL